MSETRITVGGDRPYEVVVGSGIASRVAETMPADAERVLVVYSAPMAQEAERLTSEIKATGRTPVSAEVPDAEAGKTADGKTVDLIDAFVGGVKRQSGQISAEELEEIEKVACPTCGSCSCTSAPARRKATSSTACARWPPASSARPGCPWR